ncbi:DUF4383 domain-containing protein [Allosphingosinicella sp.]|jgi:hypothetical protein|uniref:DUF4383 domain-containing protein n=1 Tax=Allosphingosinicella sp. TaxID=2823234 RepID=UPI002EDE1918
MNTRTFALLFGIVFLAVGVGSFFIVDKAAVPDPDLTMTHGFGHGLNLLPINTVHNAIHIVFGLWGLAASRSVGGSVSYARAVAVIYAVLTVMGLGLVEGTDTTFGFVPIYGNDVWFHGALTVVAAYFGWMHRNEGAAGRG